MELVVTYVLLQRSTLAVCPLLLFESLNTGVLALLALEWIEQLTSSPSSPFP